MFLTGLIIVVFFTNVNLKNSIKKTKFAAYFFYKIRLTENMNFNFKLFCRLYAVLPIFFLSCKKNDTPNIQNIKGDKQDFEIISIYAHDMNSFTEGFFFDNKTLFESTGSPNDLPDTKSVFGILDLKTGSIDVKAELDKNLFFGEGIAKSKDKIFQLTYKNKIGFIYNSKTFKQIGTFQFENEEGWGLASTEDGTLIMSDGTNILTFVNPHGFKVISRIHVLDNEKPVYNLNELEYVDGYIYANVYTTSKIVKINPSNGKVIKTMNLDALSQEAKSRFTGALEMNGIAYNKIKKTFLVTGKMWPCVFEIKFIE